MDLHYTKDMETTTFQTTTPVSPALLEQVWRFDSLVTALEFRSNVFESYHLLHGSDGLFWLARPYIAGELHRLGLPYVKAVAA